MPDDRYLDGDPAAESVCYMDLSPFVQQTQQEMILIGELIQAKRYEDALEVALGRQLRAESILKTLEAPKLRQVDIERSEDVRLPGKRAYK